MCGSFGIALSVLFLLARFHCGKDQGLAIFICLLFDQDLKTKRAVKSILHGWHIRKLIQARISLEWREQPLLAGARWQIDVCFRFEDV